MVSFYLDASVLVSLFVKEIFTSKAEAYLRSAGPGLIVNDFAAAEFASALSKHVRVGTLAFDRAQTAFTLFDAWIAKAARRVSTSAADVRMAESYLRRLDLTLRTPDALNIAIAQRFNAALASFDQNMIANARILGTPIVVF